MKKIILLSAAILSFGMLSAQNTENQNIIEVTQLSEGIYRLFVDNRVAVLVQTGPDGALVVDAAYERTGEQLKEAISKLTDKPVKFLINTHLHGDHTGGNAALGKDAHIIAHPSVKDFLSQEQKRGENTLPAAPLYARPDICIEGKTTLSFNGENVEILPLPGGHTRGDLIVYFPSAKVLQVGDLLFAGYFPYVDISNGGNPMIYLQNVEWILNNYPDEVKFVGGHGPVFTKQQMQEHLNALKETVEVMRSAKKAGMDAEKMKVNQVLKKWEDFGKFFITADRWIETVYPYL